MPAALSKTPNKKMQQPFVFRAPYVGESVPGFVQDFIDKFREQLTAVRALTLSGRDIGVRELPPFIDVLAMEPIASLRVNYTTELAYGAPSDQVLAGQRSEIMPHHAGALASRERELRAAMDAHLIGVARSLFVRILFDNPHRAPLSSDAVHALLLPPPRELEQYGIARPAVPTLEAVNKALSDAGLEDLRNLMGEEYAPKGAKTMEMAYTQTLYDQQKSARVLEISQYQRLVINLVELSQLEANVLLRALSDIDMLVSVPAIATKYAVQLRTQSNGFVENGGGLALVRKWLVSSMDSLFAQVLATVAAYKESYPLVVKADLVADMPTAAPVRLLTDDGRMTSVRELSNAMRALMPSSSTRSAVEKLFGSASVNDNAGFLDRLTTVVGAEDMAQQQVHEYLVRSMDAVTRQSANTHYDRLAAAELAAKAK